MPIAHRIYTYEDLATTPDDGKRSPDLDLGHPLATDGGLEDDMAHVEKTIEVDVPVRTAYDQWTQFEEFPRFMEGVEEVQQMGDKRLHWRAKVGGKAEEWDAEILEQTPDHVVSWRSTGGAENSGAITFTPVDANRTRVSANIGYDPEGIVENAGDKLGFMARRVEGDLERFKEFIEKRGVETGAWRGEIHGGQVEGRQTNV